MTELLDVEDVRAGVDAAVAEHLASLEAELADVGPGGELIDLVSELRALAGGGKRLRAAFCYWAWRAHGGDETAGSATRRTVLSVGAALELFQAAALAHDDVMDDSDTRRGRTATHRAFAEVHRSSGWAGPADRFGESVAILLGDLSLIAGERVFAEAAADFPPDTRAVMNRAFGRMRTEVIAGQYLDVLGQARPPAEDAAAQEELARAVIRAKSARYSVEVPLVLGAAAAGGDDAALARMHRIGLPLGEAFQLRDDLLGVFGDPVTTGKPAGDDLREGKRTVLVARALAVASPADRDLLVAGLGRRDLSAGDVDELRRALRRTGADAAVEHLIGELGGPALRELAESPLSEPGRSMLAGLARAAVERSA